ncbi:hypothetical protein PTI45_03962 [Paenibacillus nuruki]|uniref:Uncharacterized protein n=1 Tax=Paenibacillus nuruki TaxID=1886670 RepID=A0A1E3KZ49_9BACL|nr:hypothetical protein [Paenibacillus nuruki]ODP26683.1 hypothetical protein PTI45_03962 [Paenibacillus nuruki]
MENMSRKEIDDRYVTVLTHNGFDIVTLKESSVSDEQGYRINHRNYDELFNTVKEASNQVDADMRKNNLSQ